MSYTMISIILAYAVSLLRHRIHSGILRIWPIRYRVLFRENQQSVPNTKNV